MVDTEAGTAENSHLEPHVGSREKKPENGMWLLKPDASDIFPPGRATYLNIATNWELSNQTEPIGIILIQINVPSHSDT